MPTKPNILFLITHDVGHQYGCFGNNQVHSPNVDRLAEESIAFDNHYCHWPLCGPARANLFTGCRPPTTRRWGNEDFFPGFRPRMGSGFASLPEHFKNNGYHTEAGGFVFHDVTDPPSWSGGHWRPDPEKMFAKRDATIAKDIPERLRGRWQSEKSMALIRERWEKLQQQGFTLEDLKEGSVCRRAKGPAVESVGEELGDLAYDGGHVAQRAVERLREMPKDQPFFYAAGFIDAHLPFMSPQKYWDLYDPSKLELPAFRKLPENTTEEGLGDCEASQYCTTHGYEEPWLPSGEESLELLHGRLAVISYYDALVGNILNALEEAGHADNTMVVFTSDHGFHDGEHGYWGKHNLWDKSMLAPLLIRMPKGERSQGRVTGLTEHVDIYPTLCDLAGLEKPDGFLEGDSMSSLVHAPATEFKQAVFAHRKHVWHDRIQTYDMANSVRTPRYRYTEYLDAQGVCLFKELFDYEDDPDESRNYADDPAYAAAQQDLQKQLHAGWQAARTL